jgi:hypothetical protein
VKWKWGILLNAVGVLLALFYLSYLAFVVITGNGPIDFETFRSIGERFIHGEAVYGVNSYYPMPYVMVFGLLAWLPKWLSLILWLGLPVAAAAVLLRMNFWYLAFAPMFAHFVGGQSSFPAMLAIFGYRKNPERLSGGLWLSLAALKPQLLIFPLAWAAAAWVREYKQSRKLPKSLLGFLLGAAILYLPSFVIYPTWPLDWLRTPRPLFERAMAGFIPRTLLYFDVPQPVYWSVLLLGALVTFYLARKKMGFDGYMIWSFLVSPFVHDYDLTQLIPVLQTPRQRIVAVIASLPTWAVIFFFYANDRAWYWVTLIPLLLYVLGFFGQTARKAPRETEISSS